MLMVARVSGQRSRLSADPRRFPAVECGWHGKPAVMMSTRPAIGLKSVVLMSVMMGAQSSCSSSTLCCITSWQYGSISTYPTCLMSRPAKRRPRPNPSYPVNRDSTLCGTGQQLLGHPALLNFPDCLHAVRLFARTLVTSRASLH